MAAYEIPFTAEPQTFVISLAGKDYRLTTAWNQEAGHWTVDFLKPDNSPILTGVPIVPGTDLLAQHAYLSLGGRVFVQSSGDVTKVPGFADLGNDSLVFFVTD